MEYMTGPMPIIFTKDASFTMDKARPGEVVLLPEDAVLYFPCGVCNRLGHNARKCPERGAGAEPEAQEDALTEDQYDAAIDMFKRERSTKAVADGLVLPLVEVNRACKTGRYSQYVKRWHGKRM